MKHADFFKLEMVCETHSFICKLLNLKPTQIELTSKLDVRYIHSKSYIKSLKYNNFSYTFLIYKIAEYRLYLTYLLIDKSPSIKLIRDNLIKYLAYSTLLMSKSEKITNSQINLFNFYFNCGKNKNSTKYVINKAQIVLILKKDNAIILKNTKKHLYRLKLPIFTNDLDNQIKQITLLKKINFQNLDFKTKTYRYIFGITANYLKYNKIKKYLIYYISIISKTKTSKILNYDPIKKTIITQFIKKYNCDKRFINFIKKLTVESVNLYLIHGDLHLKNIIYNKKWYIIDLESLREGTIEKDIAATSVAIYLRYGPAEFENFMNIIKKKTHYNKNILFLEILSKLDKFNVDLNPIKEILTAINDWERLYNAL